MHPRPHLRSALATLLAASLVGNVSLAQATVPLKAQAVLVTKILLFDRTLPKGRPAQVVVVYGDERGAADELIAALASSKAVQARAVPVGDVASVSAADAVYFFPKGLVGPTKDAAFKAKALTFGSEGAMAVSGGVGVALTTLDGKAKILVNLGVVKAHGHELSSDLLGLSKIVP